MMTKTTISLTLACSLISVTNGATISVSNYSYAPGPNPSLNYPDDSGSELTDGTVQTSVWGGADPVISDPLVGFENTAPSITFNFESTQTVRSVSVWSADSETVAAVLLPATITVRTADNSFSQIFNVTNPAGSGTMVELELTGFEVTTDSLIIEPRRFSPGVIGDDWIMLSEVSFDTVPEPSSALLLAFVSLGLARRRR